MARVILVEGESDAAAVRSVAALLGRDLAAAGVEVVAMGGITNVGAHLDRHADAGVAGLCDAGEQGVVRRALARHGVTLADGDDLAAHGFFVCSADLEEELIRALGPAAVQQVLAAEGELWQFRVFQRQPAHRRRDLTAQLHRFVGTRAGRKVRLGRELSAALTVERVPAPLRGLLEYVGTESGHDRFTAHPQDGNDVRGSRM